MSRAQGLVEVSLWVHPACPSITTMKQFFKIKRKKSPNPPRQPILPEKPANVAAGSPGLRAELDVTIPGDGGRNVSDNDPEADRTDLTVPPNGGTIGTRVLFQDGMDGGQELHASGAPTSVVTVGGTCYGNQLASKCSWFLQWNIHAYPCLSPY